MAVSVSYRDYIVERLAPLVPLRVRPMFGELGLYAGEVFFALIADDTLYFKVDASTRPAYEAAGMMPFAPYGAAAKAMPYFQVPEDVLDDPAALREWADQAIAVAERTRRKPRKRS